MPVHPSNNISITPARVSTPSERAETVHSAEIAYRPFGAFRFLLAMMVVVSHSHSLGGLTFLAPLGLGNMAVMTFFVLSGYVIAEALDIFYPNRPGAFLMNRALRIYPPFFVALLLSIALHAWAASQRQLLFFDPVSSPSTIFAASNIVGNALSMIVLYGSGRLGLSVDYLFVRYAWAVAIELKFYLTIALFVYLAIRAKVYWPAVTIAFLGAFLAAMVAHKWIYGAVWIPYFILGIAIYRRQMILGWVCFFLVNWHAFTYISRDPNSNLIACLMILDALILGIWTLSYAKIDKRHKPVDRLLGDLTYPLYLNHYVITIVMLTFFADAKPSLVLFFATVALALIFSYGAMLLTEPITRGIRDRIRGRRV